MALRFIYRHMQSYLPTAYLGQHQLGYLSMAFHWRFPGQSPTVLLSQPAIRPRPRRCPIDTDSVFWGSLYGWGLYFALHPDDSPGFGRGFPITVLSCRSSQAVRDTGSRAKPVLTGAYSGLNTGWLLWGDCWGALALRSKATVPEV